ncbi:hypothetical protein B0T18DRAFT_385099 [Schizothecium vesticola]|uniref:Uncharacterized protein n=1 Tax=Schizothecium vesticola TaxID=314040 RepID=A0AA40F834_9PEZI|nr:hypothetical protein B0T18DRAFT_385099 [Schizothecium vesticola]
MRLLLCILFLSTLITWSGAQLTISPPTLDPWIWWSLKADTVFDAKVASMPAGTIGAPRAAKKREGSLGFSRQYEGATLYTAGGSDLAYAVNGDILGRYLAVGGPAGALGLPTSDWTGGGDNRGWYNTFRNGAIYWTPTTRAWEVHTQIYARWLSFGGHRSWLGYPVTGVQAGSSGTGIERISAFENGLITWNTNSNGAVAAFGYRDLLVAKYNAIGGPKSKLGLPTVRSMPFFLDGLGSARMAFRGGSVWVPLDTTHAVAQYQTQIQVRLLGVQAVAPTGSQSRVSGALSVFVPSTRAFGSILKLSDWSFQSPNNRVRRTIYPDYGVGNADNLLYDGPPADLLFTTQHVEVRTSSAAGVANYLAASMGLDIIGRVVEADGPGNPPIDVDKAFAGEAGTWPFRIGQTTQQTYGQTDTVYPSGTLRLSADLVNQHSQHRGQCITDLSTTNCGWHLRVSDTITVQAPAGATAVYNFHFIIEQWQVWLNL